MPTASSSPTILSGTAPSLKRCTYGKHDAPIDQFYTRIRPNGSRWTDSWCIACRRRSNAENAAAGMYLQPTPGPGIHASRVKWIGMPAKGRPAARRRRIHGVNDNGASP